MLALRLVMEMVSVGLSRRNCKSHIVAWYMQ